MKKYTLAYSLILTCFNVLAQGIDVPINIVTEEGIGNYIGSINIKEGDYGLLFTPNLKGLPPGIHGFHIHQNASCAPGISKGKNVAALSAGGHFDPQQFNKHLGPYDPNGHLGDLPPIYVDINGNAKYPVLSPKIKHIQTIQKHAIMIHAGGDNNSDVPSPLGGGGARIACGVIN